MPAPSSFLPLGPATTLPNLYPTAVNHGPLPPAPGGFSAEAIFPFGQPPTGPVPNLAGDTQAQASLAILTAGFTVGSITSAYNNFTPAGQVLSQSPPAGSIAILATPVSFVLSLGPQHVTVPDVIGLVASLAEGELVSAGLTVGTISGTTSDSIPIGSVATQSPVAGSLVTAGSPVNLGISFIVPPFDLDATVISQYANSPTILQLVADFGQWFDPSQNLQNFYITVWNIDTASGFGLDIWGIILGVSRIVPIPGTSAVFGFQNSDTPPDWENFGNLYNPGAGGPFFGGQSTGSSYKLADDPYRTLLLTKALANICTTTAPALNALITNLFPGRGRCYVQDLGHMTMAYVFEFLLTSVEFAILAYSGVLAHPAGVGVTINVVESGFFGFQSQLPDVEPLGQGPFFAG